MSMQFIGDTNFESWRPRNRWLDVPGENAVLDTLELRTPGDDTTPVIIPDLGEEVETLELDDGGDGLDPLANAATNFVPSEAQIQMWKEFESLFSGMEDFDVAREEFLAGRLDWLPTDFSYFNNQVPDQFGNFAGGFVPIDGTEGGFFTSTPTGSKYVESYTTEPEDNPVDEGGIKRFHQVTGLDGTEVWTIDPAYMTPARQESLTRTEALVADEEAAAVTAAGIESSTSILSRLVKAFRLPNSVVTKLKAMMVDGLSEEAIALEIRQTTEYADRFPGMTVRLDNGFAPISEHDYMVNEDTYANLLRLHGLPPRFYDDRQDFATLIGQDVSPEEFGERVNLAELATKGADPFTKAELKRLYGVDETDLVAYYLDPKSATNLIQERRSFEAAGLSATGMRVTGQDIGFDKDVANALQREGVQRREIQQRLAPQTGLTGGTLTDPTGMLASDLAAGEFGLNPEATTRLRRKREGRVVDFSGQSGLLSSSGGIAGLGAST